MNLMPFVSEAVLVHRRRDELNDYQGIASTASILALIVDDESQDT